jgi:alkylation response protein AidB-like acyl-CoA dehydrogenase
MSSSVDRQQDLSPFAKDLYLGKVDVRVLAYPDVLDGDAMRELNVRCRGIRSQLKEKSEHGGVDRAIIDSLRTLGVYGLQGDRELGGQGLTVTETMKTLEELSANLSLSEAVTVPNTIALAPLLRYGSAQQRDKYLQKLLSGDWIGSICVTDDGAGVDANGTDCRAVHDDKTGDYVLNGVKSWVTNGSDCNLYTVFANVLDDTDDDLRVNPLTAFLVERTTEGISVQRGPEKTGLTELDTAIVSFDNVRVPAENVLVGPGTGGTILADCCVRERVFAGARVSAALRTLFNYTLSHAIERRTVGSKPMVEFDNVRHRLAKMAATLYALESVSYMTAGLTDASPAADVEMETCMTKAFALRASKMIVEGCTRLLGSRAFVQSHPAAGLRRDLEALDLWEGTEDMNLMTIGLMG